MGKNDGEKSKNEVYKILQIMAQYINKDALVAEIERRKQVAFGWMETAPNDAIEAEFELCDDILSFINTLEVKEVDLEKEIDNYFNTSVRKNLLANDNVTLFMQCYKVAKHFFELGLSLQQNINIDITDIDKVIEKNGVDPNSKEAKMFKESYYMTLEKLKAQKGE